LSAELEVVVTRGRVPSSSECVSLKGKSVHEKKEMRKTGEKKRKKRRSP